MSSMNPTQSGKGFLSFNSLPPRLHITAEDVEFDEETLQLWRNEGYDVTYHPCNVPLPTFRKTVQSFAADLELGEAYGIIAYGDAAVACLDIATKPLAHCAAIVCYYPTSIPQPSAKYPTQLNLLAHIAAGQGIETPKNFKAYYYEDVDPGFAEKDLDEYDRLAAGLAWSRTLSMIRKGFKRDDPDLEFIATEKKAFELQAKNAAGVMGTMTAEPYMNCVPTMTGGVGKRDLYRFYHNFLIPSTPASLRSRLVSRTMGTDRIVDEILLSFKHTQEIPWMLPGVPPTDKAVEVGMVSVLAVKGNRIEHEHLYWDQASVLVQIGALDPNLVPEPLKRKGCKRLPVVGADAARKLRDIEALASNGLVTNWTQNERRQRGKNGVAKNAQTNGTPAKGNVNGAAAAELAIRNKNV